jgi:hypothetical protein
MSDRSITTLHHIDEIDIPNKPQANAAPLGKYLFINSDRLKKKKKSKKTSSLKKNEF